MRHLPIIPSFQVKIGKREDGGFRIYTECAGFESCFYDLPTVQQGGASEWVLAEVEGDGLLVAAPLGEKAPGVKEIAVKDMGLVLEPESPDSGLEKDMGQVLEACTPESKKADTAGSAAKEKKPENKKRRKAPLVEGGGVGGGGGGGGDDKPKEKRGRKRKTVDENEEAKDGATDKNGATKEKGKGKRGRPSAGGLPDDGTLEKNQTKLSFGASQPAASASSVPEALS
jgi:hypothetical protein